jgi:hypothetical protein
LKLLSETHFLLIPIPLTFLIVIVEYQGVPFFRILFWKRGPRNRAYLRADLSLALDLRLQVLKSSILCFTYKPLLQDEEE